MPRPVKRTATTDFPRRRARALVTRGRVLEAARALFVERGYVATTVGSIADLADVSPETIYSTFGTKRALLSEVLGVSIAGAATAPPILEQEWVRAMRAEPDPSRRSRMLAAAGRSILERRAAIDDVVREAASSDPDIAALHERGKAERLAGQRELLRIVAGEAGLRDGIELDEAADILYAIGSPETYRLLVVDRGWSGARFERWYGDALERLLLEPR